MQLGVSLPLVDIGGAPAVVREFALAAEAQGYHHLGAPDHVLGANPARAERAAGIAAGYFHDPFVLFGFLSGITTRIGFATEVLILAQRQTVLVAKQAASLDVLCGGRFRLGVGVGWNRVEFVGLNENFHDRGKRSEEQVQVMKLLWAEPHVTFTGCWHTIEDAGINPRPTGGTIPLWFGGHHDQTLRRIAKWGDGWMPLAYPADQSALEAFATLRRYVQEAGRDPASIGIEVWVSAAGDENDWRREVQFWKNAGVTHVTLHNTFRAYHHKRIEGRTLSDHLDAMRRYHNAVADLL
jgi:probable F420-dependent oxidoreductase